MQKSVEVLIHIKFLLNNGLLERMANLIYDCTWIVGINESEKNLLTSDNPVTLVRDPSQFDLHFFSGIETISYPLNSKMILMLTNPQNKKFALDHNTYVNLQPIAIDYYNNQQALYCNRYIYGNDIKTIEQSGCRNFHKKKSSPREINNSLLSLNAE